MSSASPLTAAAATAIAPSLIKKIGLRYVAFGLAAYFGLKYLSQKGLLPKTADKALGFVDKGVDLAKEQLGFTQPLKQPLKQLASSNIH